MSSEDSSEAEQRDEYSEEGFPFFMLDDMTPIEEQYFEKFNMDLRAYKKLFRILKPKIKEQHNNNPVPAHTRLQICLRYLVTGNEMSLVAEEYGVSENIVQKSIVETCEAIWDSLNESAFPELNIDYWDEVCTDFDSGFQTIHCMGMVDMKRLMLEEHAHKGSNYNPDTDCLTLFTITNFRRNILHMHMTMEKLVNNRMNFESTKAFEKLQDNKFNVPPPADYGTASNLPYFFVSDTNFPLNIHMLQAYPKIQKLTIPQRVYNVRIKEASELSGNLFNLIFWRWKVLVKKFTTDLQTTTKIVKAIFCLHNYLAKSVYLYLASTPSTRVNSEGCIKLDMYSVQSTEAAESLRDRFKEVMYDVTVSSDYLESVLECEHMF